MARSPVCTRWAPTQTTQCTACARLTTIPASRQSCTIQARRLAARKYALTPTANGLNEEADEQKAENARSARAVRPRFAFAPQPRLALQRTILPPKPSEKIWRVSKSARDLRAP